MKMSPQYRLELLNKQQDILQMLIKSVGSKLPDDNLFKVYWKLNGRVKDLFKLQYYLCEETGLKNIYLPPQYW